TITVSSFGQVLRGKYVLQPEDADTPVRKLYFCIQMLLIAGCDEQSLRHASKLGAFVFTQMDKEDDQATLLQAMDMVSMRDFYKALVKLHPLLELHAAGGRRGATSYPQELEAENQAFHHNMQERMATQAPTQQRAAH
ncbi:MAG: flagellar biosynthesis repressor FlbT, partial [Parvularcula sp.]|nr:flagellar biosynthesis repressor FlbT [Parvularcula sp.]